MFEGKPMVNVFRVYWLAGNFVWWDFCGVTCAKIELKDSWMSWVV